MTSPLTDFAADALHVPPPGPTPFMVVAMSRRADLDACFDAAVDDAAAAPWPGAGVFADLDPADLQPTGPADLCSVRTAMLAATAALAAGATGAWAMPVAADSMFTRRRARLVITDTGAAAPSGPGLVTDPALLAALLEQAASAGFILGPGERLEAVRATTVRDAYRPVVAKFAGPMAGAYALVDPASATIVDTGHPTAGAARRAAVAMLRQEPTAGALPRRLDVVKVSMRSSGPLMAVTATRRRRRVVVTFLAATPKANRVLVPAGWLFFGVV